MQESPPVGWQGVQDAKPTGNDKGAVTLVVVLHFAIAFFCILLCQAHFLTFVVVSCALLPHCFQVVKLLEKATVADIIVHQLGKSFAVCHQGTCSSNETSSPGA